MCLHEYIALGGLCLIVLKLVSIYENQERAFKLYLYQYEVPQGDEIPHFENYKTGWWIALVAAIILNVTLAIINNLS